MAVSRTSIEPPTTEVPEPSQGLSVATLIIAAIASGIAAIVVSRFWDKGTIVASAMTPVIVAVVSEALRKPVESERLRSGVRSVSSAARPSGFARPRSGRTPNVMAPPTPGVDDGLRQREEGVEAGPVRVYSSGSNKRPRGVGDKRGVTPRRRLHLKIAVITGLVAFLIAAAVLTLPELIFGGSVTGGGRSTTVFGGGSKSTDNGKSQDGGKNDGKPGDTTQQSPDSTTPGDKPSQGSGGDQTSTTAPESTTPPSQNTSPAPAPTPAPPSPTPPSP